MTGAPVWEGATAGQPPLASQINQFLGPHAATMVYAGTQRAAQSTTGSGAVASNGLWIAQSFTTAAGQTAAGRVVLTLAVTGNPAPLIVSLYANSAGAPTGSALVSAAVPREFLSGTAVALSIPLPATVTASTTYWIVAAAVGDASNYFSWSKSNQTSGTSTSTNGTAWTTQTYGLLFQVYDHSVTGSLTHTFEDSGARWTGFGYTTGRVTGLQEYTAAQASGYVKANSALTYSGMSLTGVTQSAGVPAWSAARSGLLGDPGAVDASAQINQFLGAHTIKCLYQGAQILAPGGVGVTPGTVNLGVNDWDQPFTMSGTTIGRVTIPVAASGNGADLVVSLCPDSSGNPGAPIVSTRIAAAWILALSAVGTLAAGSSAPLATAATNILTTSPGTVIPYPTPAVSINGASQAYGGFATAGNNILSLGGQDSSGTAVASVFSIAYTGGTTLAPPVPQPSMPAPLVFPAIVATADTLVVAGGSNNSATPTAQAGVYTASLNTATGAVSAWSVQTPLPQGTYGAAIASSGENVYVMGGVAASGFTSNAYWATVQNGQITAWKTLPPVPLETSGSGTVAVVVNGYLVLMNAVGASNLYYAAINPDGSLGGWQSVPNLLNPTIVATAIPGVGMAYFNQTGFRSSPINNTTTFSVGPTGPAPTYQTQLNGIATGAAQPITISAFPTGTGTWQLFGLLGNAYFTQQLSLTPNISVPLPATGLTNGGTYHVTMSQQGGDINNHLTVPMQSDAYTGNPTALHRARSGGSGWTATTAGNAIPITFYDQTVSGTWPLHTWEDSGARHTMFVNNTTPDNTPLGYLEATAQPAPVLNMNPTFTTGTAPWAATGGTITQSAAFTHGNLPYSGLLTPSGSATTAYVESEKIPVFQGHSHIASAWLYSPTGYANCVVNINWYNPAGTLLSTTTGTTTALTAATWTALTTTGAVPAAAATGTVVVAETGTPPATAVLYIYAAMQDTSGPMLPSIAQINYAGAGLGQPAVGITQLA